MTLKEEFDITMVSYLIDKNQDTTLLDHFSKITEKFAIEFGEYILDWHNDVTSDYLPLILEQFKKEKGL
jgi:hypothetical protein